MTNEYYIEESCSVHSFYDSSEGPDGFTSFWTRYAEVGSVEGRGRTSKLGPMGPVNPLSTAVKGHLGEQWAMWWLYNQGYEVFMNALHVGPADMIARIDGELVEIDVTTRRGSALRKLRTKPKHIRILLAHSPNKCEWVDR